MNLTTFESSPGYWRADLDCLPGSPPAGEGRTEAEAIACLFHRVLFDCAPGRHRASSWLSIIWEEMASEEYPKLRINGRLWASGHPQGENRR